MPSIYAGGETCSIDIRGLFVKAAAQSIVGAGGDRAARARSSSIPSSSAYSISSCVALSCVIQRAKIQANTPTVSREPSSIQIAPDTLWSAAALMPWLRVIAS